MLRIEVSNGLGARYLGMDEELRERGSNRLGFVRFWLDAHLQPPSSTADRGQYKIIAYVLAMLCHI
jgi:hypothetical protein